ncbi:MAG: YfjI family protein [Oscillospiraceae bacterium]|nr:YfjI family protein [Oscillospiraceae bacterium]
MTENTSLTRRQKADMLKESGFSTNDTYNADDEDIFDRLKHQNDIPVWEPPIPFDIINLPDFPVNDLPVTVSAYVRAVAETTQTSPDMAAVASLAILSLCLQGKFIIEGKKDWVEGLNLYTVIVATPAERKSAVLKHITVPLVQYELQENRRLAPLIEQNKMEKSVLENRRKILEAQFSKDKDSDAAQMRELSDEISEFKDVKPCRLFYDDITPQKLATVLSDNGGKTAILSSEGGIFDILAGKYSNNTPDIDIFLKAHSGDSIRVDRQGRQSEYVNNPALTALIFTQPNVIENLMSNAIFHGRGLCGRFLYSLPKSTVGTRKFVSSPIPEITADMYFKLVGNLLKIKVSEPKTIKLSERAYEALKTFYEKVEPMIIDELADIKDFAGKFVGSVLRIAGLLYLTEFLPDHVNFENIQECDLVLPENFITRAIIIGEYFLEHAKVAYQIMGSDEVTEQCKYILRQLKKSKPDRITVRDVNRACRKFNSADEVLIPIKRLCEYGYLREAKVIYSGTGRPSSAQWEVNPAIYNE